MKTFLVSIILLLMQCSFAQDTTYGKQNVLRLNFINPGIEYEHSISKVLKLNSNVGFGVSAIFPNTAVMVYDKGFFFSAFLDIQFRAYYDTEDRIKRGRNVEYNAGDFFGFKFNGRGPDIKSDLVRSSSFDFYIGPIWGLKRNYDKLNILFDFGPVYYFDNKYNGYYAMLELCLGYNIWAKNK